MADPRSDCWLISDDRVLASLEVAADRSSRRRGLLGRDHYEGAMLFPRTRSIHTIGMRFALDVAFCDADLVVQRIVSLPPWRVAFAHPGERSVIEAEAGAFATWNLGEGDRLEIR